MTLKILNLENHRDFFSKRITTTKNKIKTLLPYRRKRGLWNSAGTGFNWIFGTMDSEDRQDIESHLNVIDQNNHNLINNLNQQISINENFNKTFMQIKTIIETDRTKILEKLNKLNSTEIKLITENTFLDLCLK